MRSPKTSPMKYSKKNIEYVAEVFKNLCRFLSSLLSESYTIVAAPFRDPAIQHI
jgi:hypothetical protein